MKITIRTFKLSANWRNLVLNWFPYPNKIYTHTKVDTKVEANWYYFDTLSEHISVWCNTNFVWEPYTKIDFCMSMEETLLIQLFIKFYSIQKINYLVNAQESHRSHKNLRTQSNIKILLDMTSLLSSCIHYLLISIKV